VGRCIRGVQEQCDYAGDRGTVRDAGGEQCEGEGDGGANGAFWGVCVEFGAEVHGGGEGEGKVMIRGGEGGLQCTAHVYVGIVLGMEYTEASALNSTQLSAMIPFAEPFSLACFDSECGRLF